MANKTVDYNYQFYINIKPAFKSDARMLKLVSFIDKSIADQYTLLECFVDLLQFSIGNWAYLKEGEQQRALKLIKVMFNRAIYLAGPLNELADFVLYWSVSSEATKLRLNLPNEDDLNPINYVLFQEGWDRLMKQDRFQLKKAAKIKKREILNNRTFVTMLRFAYQKEMERDPDLEEKEKNRKPTLDELLDYDPLPTTPRKEFDHAVQVCRHHWDKLSRYRNVPFAAPQEADLKDLDRAFEELQAVLQDAGRKHWRYFYQMWKWTREPLKPKMYPGSTKPTTGSIYGSADYEIYLEACYCALWLAVNHWHMLHVNRAIGTSGQDQDFFVQPLHDPLDKQARNKLATRLKWIFRYGYGETTITKKGLEKTLFYKGAREFKELTRIRRRMNRFGSRQGLEHLDEFETAELVKKVLQINQNDPEKIKKMVVKSFDPTWVAYRKNFSIFHEINDHFFIYWSEQPRVDRVIVEFKQLPFQLFATDSFGLARLLRESTFVQIAKASNAALALFVEQLEKLGVVMDIISLGVTSGLRQMAIKYIKGKVIEKIKSKVVDTGLDLWGVKDEGRRTAAHLAFGFVPGPKLKLKGRFDPSNAEVALQRRVAIQAKNIEGRLLNKGTNAVKVEQRNLSRAAKGTTKDERLLRKGTDAIEVGQRRLGKAAKGATKVEELTKGQVSQRLAGGTKSSLHGSTSRNSPLPPPPPDIFAGGNGWRQIMLPKGTKLYAVGPPGKTPVKWGAFREEGLIEYIRGNQWDPNWGKIPGSGDRLKFIEYSIEITEPTTVWASKVATQFSVGLPHLGKFPDGGSARKIQYWRADGLGKAKEERILAVEKID